ncbi:MAG: ABC transporter ATP-binding protein [Bacteroidia bacterium]|nr:ABC transporter ATP-binding protein [Bacteroidia bacterium]
MKISLQNIGKRFNQNWIFRKLSYDFESGNKYAILGVNGSGKTTLLQIISGYSSISEGEVHYHNGDSKIEIDNVFKHIGYAGPYVELIEDFTLNEQLDFHYQFKNPINGTSKSELIKKLGFDNEVNKYIKDFSSGMKQRVKLSLAIMIDVPVILLDEPTTNLDAQGVEWYLKLIDEYMKDQLLIISSNQEREYSFCEHQLKLENFKQ